jgi:porphobilinogen deaminase
MPQTIKQINLRYVTRVAKSKFAIRELNLLAKFLKQNHPNILAEFIEQKDEGERIQQQLNTMWNRVEKRWLKN